MNPHTKPKVKTIMNASRHPLISILDSRIGDIPESTVFAVNPATGCSMLVAMADNAVDHIVKFEGSLRSYDALLTAIEQYLAPN